MPNKKIYIKLYYKFNFIIQTFKHKLYHVKINLDQNRSISILSALDKRHTKGK